MARAHQPLSELDQFLTNRPTYWEVRCNDCLFSTSCWYKEEAEFRGEIHRQHQDGQEHDCDVAPVALRHTPPDHLGFGEGRQP